MSLPVIAADVSVFQHVLTDAYGRRLLIMRVCFGAHYTDQHFLANANVAAQMYRKGDIDGVILYTVYLASASPAEQYAAVWKLIGPTVPAWLIGIMIDVESWRGTSYPISGDHSKQLNTLYGLHAHKMGTWSAVIGYGNAYDLAEIWPSRDARCQVIVASYSSSLTYKKVRGAIGQQYTDGQTKWSVPKIGGKALPRTSAPFGACDHNVFPGFASAASLRAHLRPATAAKPVTKPTKVTAPAKPAKFAPHYQAPKVTSAHAVVATNRAWALFLHDDGRIEIRHNGTHVRYL